MTSVPQNSPLPISPESDRPEVTVYWAPGCSSCLKLKEFVELQNIEFESVNIHACPEAVEEIYAAGLRGAPVLRRGRKYIYAQNLDEVASLLSVERHHTRLPRNELVVRWEAILEKASTIVDWLPADQLERRAIIMRDRPVRKLAGHIFQIADNFLLALDGKLKPDREALLHIRMPVDDQSSLKTFALDVVTRFRDWRIAGGVNLLPERMATYYGNQSIDQILERGTWHSAQHARQLDTIAAGIGAEFAIPAELYAGLPMPQRLWN